jgi:hypothetical protein
MIYFLNGPLPYTSTLIWENFLALILFNNVSCRKPESLIMITNIESEYITILSKNMYVYNEKKTATYILGVKIKPIISRK